MHRRYLLDSVDAHQRAQSRTVIIALELRGFPFSAAKHGVLVDLWSRNGESESSRLHRDVPQWIARCRFPELAKCISSREFSRDLHRHQHEGVEKLLENIQNKHAGYATQRQQLDLLQKINAHHSSKRDDDDRFDARIQSFELAYRMQMEATDAFDISKEPKYIREMYGEGLQARQILIARRLAERGVRYTQVWTGYRQPWDNHDDLETEHRKLCGECDKPIAALLKDLKMRGLLEDTLVIWGGEFGRTPVVELSVPGANKGKVNGRDHNNHGFSMWMAGGGVRGGYVHGATDEFGFAAVENQVHVHDLQATILHLMGFDHERFTYRYAGRDFRLADVHGNVVHELIA